MTGRVLLVEDLPLARNTTVRMLISLGYEVTSTDDASAAMEILQENNYDILFADILISGDLDGLSLAKIVAKRYPTLKILLTSGFSILKSEELAAIRAVFLPKPYRKADLAVVLAGFAQED